jgi:hypothetical protein
MAAAVYGTPVIAIHCPVYPSSSISAKDDNWHFQEYICLGSEPIAVELCLSIFKTQEGFYNAINPPQTHEEAAGKVIGIRSASWQHVTFIIQTGTGLVAQCPVTLHVPFKYSQVGFA